MIAGIDGGNPASLRLHAQAGFVEVARMPEVGRKFGRWLELVFMQRVLDAPGSIAARLAAFALAVVLLAGQTG